MSYYGTTINDSAVIAGVAASDITGASFLAAKFDANGKIIKNATAGGSILGLFIGETGDVKAGDDVSVQIKDIGLWTTGAAVAAGAELMSDADGKAVTVTAAKSIAAIALEAASAAGAVIKVQICKAGYAPATV